MTHAIEQTSNSSGVRTIPDASFNTDATYSMDLASEHLRLLDPVATKFTFQVFDDNKDRKDRKLARVITSSLEDCFRELVDASKRGAGVFVTVNETDLRGRKRGNITRVRAVWQEDDGDGKPLPIEPSFTIESSPGHYHNYMLTDGPLSEFEGVERRLVDDYGSDPNAMDISRVLRLAGFPHQKVCKEKGLVGTPFIVRVTKINDVNPKGWDVITQLLPPVSKKVNLAELHEWDNERGFATPDWWTDLNDGEKNTELTKMLSTLPSEVVEDQDKWLSIMAACNRSGAADAEEICRQWSGKSRQHSDTEFDSRYRSYVNMSSGHPITLFTLEKMALENGYVPKYQELKLPPIPNHISGQVTPAAEGAHIPELRGGKYSRKNTLKLMNQKYFAATWGNTYTLCERTANGSFRLMSEKEFRLATQNKMVVTKDGKLMTIGKFWLGHEKRQEYDRIVFDPKETPEGCINLYRGCGMESAAGDCSLLKQHIKEVICNEDAEHYEYLMNLLALRVQQPWRKIEVALVMRSEKEGTGKGTFAGWVMDMVGRDYSIHATSRDQVVGRFNKHLETCLVLFADEAMFTGDKKNDPILKTMISEKTIMIENKYEKAYQAKNRSFVIIATNQEHSINASASARRIFSPTISEKYAQSSEYFVPLNKQAREGGTAALLHELLQRNIIQFDHRNVPKTAELFEQQINSLDSIDQWLLSVADQERLVIPCDYGSRENLLGEWVLNKSTMDAYLHWCKEHRIYYIETDRKVGARLNKLQIPRVKEPRNASNRNGRMFPTAEILKSLVLDRLNAAK